MNRLKNALTRKIGPFAAWMWFAIAGGALYFYRRHTAGGGGGDQQQGGPALTYYGPYGQDAYPIQGGAGTGPGISGDTGSGTNNDGGNTNGGPPVINIAAPPTAPNSNGGKPRTQKPQPKHKKKVKVKKPSILGKGKKSAKRSDASTHTNQARTKTTSKGGTKHSRSRTPVDTNKAGGQTVTPGHGKQVTYPATHGLGTKTVKPPPTEKKKTAPAPGASHPSAPAHTQPPPAKKPAPKPAAKPATRKVTRR